MRIPLDIQSLLDPEIARIIAAFPMDFGNVRIEDIPAVRAQRITAMPEVTLSDATERRDHDASGVLVRVHRPANEPGPLPCIVWMHGGGYMFGTYAMDDVRFDRWCPRMQCVAVSVEYRLAPEHPYPAPLEDCHTALRWLYDNAAELGVDRDRIGIGGASAGGGLAAALALLARDRGEVPLAFQLLIYPMIDDRQATPSSAWDVPIWPPHANILGWRAYLGPLYGGDVPPHAAAARATDLSGLPPAFVTVGALDGFLDEDVAYASGLNRAGVPTELHVYPGAPHGFDSIAVGAQVSRRARAHMQEWLSAAMHTARATI